MTYPLGWEAKLTEGYIAKEVPLGTLINPERLYQQGGQNQLMVTSTKQLLFAYQEFALGAFSASWNYFGKPTKRRIAKSAVPY